jgi:hypothetical protein
MAVARRRFLHHGRKGGKLLHQPSTPAVGANLFLLRLAPLKEFTDPAAVAALVLKYRHYIAPESTTVAKKLYFTFFRGFGNTKAVPGARPYAWQTGSLLASGRFTR